MSTKNVLVKSLKLDKCFKDFATKKESRKEIFEKFKTVWGNDMANHFLCNYNDAESLIWAFDSRNLELFIEKF